MTKSKALEVILKQDKYLDCKVCLGECSVEESNSQGSYRVVCKQCKGAGKLRNPQYAKACSKLGLAMPPKYYEPMVRPGVQVTGTDEYGREVKETIPIDGKGRAIVHSVKNFVVTQAPSGQGSNQGNIVIRGRYPDIQSRALGDPLPGGCAGGGAQGPIRAGGPVLRTPSVPPRLQRLGPAREEGGGSGGDGGEV